jgi:hypothetical protein
LEEQSEHECEHAAEKEALYNADGDMIMIRLADHKQRQHGAA